MTVRKVISGPSPGASWW